MWRRVFEVKEIGYLDEGGTFHERPKACLACGGGPIFLVEEAGSSGRLMSSQVWTCRSCGATWSFGPEEVPIGLPRRERLAPNVVRVKFGT